jgi:hypothetical protein
MLLSFVVFLLAAAAGVAKSPADTPTVCDRYQHSDLIFTGSAERTWITMLETRKSPIHKRSEKSKRVRFLVREWYKGQRRNTVEVWMTPGECPLTVAADQNYLVYARLNKDNGRIESNACMGTIAAGSAASDLTYLTAAQLGPAQATRISGNAGGPNLNVIAKSGINNRYAATDAAGLFTFDGLPAGDWALAVVGGGPEVLTHLAPGSCVIVDLAAR